MQSHNKWKLHSDKHEHEQNLVYYRGSFRSSSKFVCHKPEYKFIQSKVLRINVLLEMANFASTITEIWYARSQHGRVSKAHWILFLYGSF